MTLCVDGRGGDDVPMGQCRTKLNSYICKSGLLFSRVCVCVCVWVNICVYVNMCVSECVCICGCGTARVSVWTTRVGVWTERVGVWTTRVSVGTEQQGWVRWKHCVDNKGECTESYSSITTVNHHHTTRTQLEHQPEERKTYRWHTDDTQIDTQVDTYRWHTDDTHLGINLLVIAGLEERKRGDNEGSCPRWGLVSTSLCTHTCVY